MALHTITNAIGKLVAKYGDDALRAVKNTADKVDDATRLAILNSGGLDDASIFLGKCTGKVDDVAELLGKGTGKVDPNKCVHKFAGGVLRIKDGKLANLSGALKRTVSKFGVEYQDAKTGIRIFQKAPEPKIKQNWFSRILDGPKPVLKNTPAMVISPNGRHFSISADDYKALGQLAEGELEKSPIWQRILKEAGF